MDTSTRTTRTTGTTRRRRGAALAGAAVLGAVSVLGAPTAAAGGGHGHHGGAHDDGPPVEVVVSGLSDPWSVRVDGRGRFVVAENGTGEVTRVSPGGTEQRVVATLPGLASADTAGRTVLALTSGGAPDAEPLPGPATLSAGPPGALGPLADLAAYELAANPDGQVQLVDGAPVDALSNPFAVLAGRGHHGPAALVADGGANAVLAVGWDGAVSTFSVPPTVTTGACAGLENNPGATGCDSVPTGLAYGPDGNVYVAALTGGVPGEGRVYVLDSGGTLVREITGFSGPTGVAVGDDGTVYVSELLEGAPEGEGPPPAGFDPSAVGRIVAVDPSGARSVAQVTMPLGLVVHHGALYSTAGSVLAQFGLAAPDAPPAGQVVRVRPSAFAAE